MSCFMYSYCYRICNILALLVLSALIGLYRYDHILVTAQAQQQQQSVSGFIKQEATLNLNAILAQQEQLKQECRRLEAIRMNELKQMLKFEQSNANWLHLDDQEHAIRLPAVCLLLNGPPNVVSSADNEATIEDGPRLDLVNWIFDPDQIAAYNSNNSMVRNTREVSDGSSLLGMVANYLFDPNDINNDQASPKTDGEKFAEQYKKLLEDDRYKSALPTISQRVEGYLSPVVLVPGLAGSRLQARFQKAQRVNIMCPKQSDWQDVWLALRWFLPVAIDCWIDNARLVYDPTTGFAREPAGVESRVPDFGSIDSVRHLDLRSPKLTKYFDSIIERYQLLGYQPDKNLFAAPYDFRLAPQQLETSFFPNLKQLIDDAYERQQAKSQQQKITLVCHSMGCTNLLYFLRLQTGDWRQSRIRKLIAISSPWGGAIKALKALLVGEQFGLPIVSESKIRKLSRTFPSVAYLLPQAEVFDQPSKYQVDTKTGGPVMVQTPQRTYNVAQLEEVLNDAGLSLQWNWYKTTTDPLKPLDPLPDVNVDCLHSLNIPTPERIIFRNQTDFPNGEYELSMADGDGTVNYQSLLVCANWASKMPDKVKHKVVKNTSHIGMLNHQQVLDHITNDVTFKTQDDDVENEV